MADPSSPGHRAGDDEPVPRPGVPRWVKVLALVAIVAIVVVVIANIAGGNHGPGRHMSSGGAGGDAVPVVRPLAVVADHRSPAARRGS